MDKNQDQLLEELVNDLDEVLNKYAEDIEPHHVCGVLLSWFVLLMTHDPVTGKGLARYIWEKLDEIEQGNPGNML